jgi:CelD/BcsL family acetyltransferase involved in cellulose biosynthesis
LQLELIRDNERLLQFAPEWCAFARCRPASTPFQLPDWLLTWWRHFGSGSARVFVFRDAACVGVLPCFLHHWNGAQQLTLVGSGISDYLDPILSPPDQPATLDCLRQHLSLSDEWEVCDWQDLAQNTPFNALSGDMWQLYQREEVPCSEAALSGTFEQYWDTRPRHLRRNVRRYADKARQNGFLEFHVTRDADPELMQALFRLHAARWQRRGESGMVEANHSAEFLLDIARQFATQNMLRVFSLRYQGGIAAVILAFAYQDRIYGYLTGFDPAYRQFSLASVLLFEAVRECYREGFRAWNFCRGNEPYKAEWGAQPVRRCRLILQRNRS